MLIGIDPLLGPGLLGALRAMGHGDEIVVADANFPATSVAAHTVLGEPLTIGCSTPRAVEAVLSVMPLDGFVDHPVARMEVVGDAVAEPEVQVEVKAHLARIGAPGGIESIERHAFYERAKNAFCVLQTTERRFYGCIVLKKGVIEPDG